MKVMLVNNDGEGVAGYVDVEEGTTLNELLRSELNGRDPDNYMVRVDREPRDGNYELREGNRVTITPKNIEGAR